MSFEEAKERVLSHAKAIGPETVSLRQSLGRVLLDEIVSKVDMPRFDNSAVDGYALSLDDLAKVGGKIRVNGRIQAGSSASGLNVSEGECFQVMTGAPVPLGTAAVIMQEDVDRQGESITLEAEIVAGRNVRPQGHEFRIGDVVARSGETVTPPVLGGLASLGLSSVVVFKRPKVALVVTGNELVSAGEELLQGQIYESNSFGIGAALTSIGIESELVSIGDDEKETARVLDELLSRCDVVLTSGGVSVGDFDFVRSALCTLGFETVVPRFSIKPGKPFAFAVRGVDAKCVFGLPGNPMSSMVTFALFAWPFLALVSGRRPPASVDALLEGEHTTSGDRVEFVPGQISIASGRLHATPEPTVGSHAVAGLAGSDCLIECPIGAVLERGAMVRAWPLPWSVHP